MFLAIIAKLINYPAISLQLMSLSLAIILGLSFNRLVLPFIIYASVFLLPFYITLPATPAMPPIARLGLVTGLVTIVSLSLLALLYRFLFPEPSEKPPANSG
jgi:hypothetical protein